MKITRTYSRVQSHGLRMIAALALVLAVSLGFLGINLASSSNTKAQSAQTIKSIILESAEECAAIEGSYPATLDYLEANYHLALNHQDYAINYEIFAQNIAPTVTVVPR